MSPKARSKREEQPTMEEYIELAESRSVMYRFLSMLYSYEPIKDLAKMIKDKSILESLNDSDGGFKLLKEYVKEAEKIKDLREELEVEHTTLFVLANDRNFRPYESVYLDPDQYMGGQFTKNVERFMKRVGFEFTSALDELPDHIAIELEFMHHMCSKEGESWKKSKKDYGLDYLKYERDFLKDHLTKWAFDFCEDLYEKAESNFFKAASLLTKDFLAMEESEIDKIIESIEDLE
ncbi:MAG: molecular chaperone [Candidatus Hydrothermarchaeaceae archaeon]